MKTCRPHYSFLWFITLDFYSKLKLLRTDLVNIYSNFHLENVPYYLYVMEMCYPESPVAHELEGVNGQKFPNRVYIKNVLGYSWHLRGSQQL